MKLVLNTTLELLNLLHPYDWDAIVVEGYDGVGKGKLLSTLSEVTHVKPYRPDYNLGVYRELLPSERWKISGFFWDICSHFNNHSQRILLFDRGVISGAVYNHDMSIAETYKSFLRDMRVLHVLVTCTKEDFKRFQESRGTEGVDIEKEWEKYLSYTDEYFRALDIAGVDYVEYRNHYSEEIASTSKITCVGCGHYNYRWCSHPNMNCEVDPTNNRCELAKDKEVQDLHDTKMQCV